jgi:hypothetical protein
MQISGPSSLTSNDKYNAFHVYLDSKEPYFNVFIKTFYASLSIVTNVNEHFRNFT